MLIPQGMTRTLAALTFGACATPAVADAFPTRPLRLITIFAAGAAADQHARYLAGKFSEQLSQNVIVENKPGAGGVIGTRDALRSRPPGYTLLLTNPSLVGNTIAYKEPGYKVEEFATVGVVGQTYYGMMVHTSVPGKTLSEFIAYAKANPNKLNYGRLGAAAGSMFAAERFKQATGIEMVGITYKGGETTTVAMMSGEIQVYFATLSSVKPRLTSPQIRVYGVTAPKRSPALPEVPTFSELGYPTVLASNWNAVMVAAETPPAILRRLREAFSKAAATQDMKTMIETQAYEPWTGTMAQFTAGLKTEAALIAEDFKRLNIKALD
jgi:tripartite-type tricarboxylate transporter receptor subunit TctC